MTLRPPLRTLAAHALLALSLSSLSGCDLGIQAASGTAASDEGPAQPRFVPDPAGSGLLGVTPEALRRHAQTFGGKALVVNLWASFCGSCKRELPMLVALRDRFASAGVGLLMLSADEPEDRAEAVALLREHGLPLPSHHLAGGVGAFRAAIEPRWEGALPATLLLDAEGRVRYFWNGPVLDEEVRPIIEGFLAGEHIDGMRDVAAKPAE